LEAALSVKTKGAGISVWIFSATALMGDSNTWGRSGVRGSKRSALTALMGKYYSNSINHNAHAC
jgi:hypothetical protein